MGETYQRCQACIDKIAEIKAITDGRVALQKEVEELRGERDILKKGLKFSTITDLKEENQRLNLALKESEEASERVKDGLRDIVNKAIDFIDKNWGFNGATEFIRQETIEELLGEDK